jgi:uncharacterized membrane protein YphA (DoxX/SURF4 family)
MIRKIDQASLVQSGLTAARLLLAAVFLYAGISKIEDPYRFVDVVRKYELGNERLALATSATLPWIEFLTGVALLGGKFVGGALVCATIMAIAFTLVQASVIWRGLTIPCGCFGGADGQTVGYATLLRAIALLMVAATGTLLSVPGPSVVVRPSIPRQSPKDACDEGAASSSGIFLEQQKGM